jgi:hypothetical protein
MRKESMMEKCYKDMSSKEMKRHRDFLNTHPISQLDMNTRSVASGGVIATARWQGRAKQLEKPSSIRLEIDGVR